MLYTFITISAYSQEKSYEQLETQINDLKSKLLELEQLQRETSLVTRNLYTDRFFDYSSRGYIEVSFGMSSFTPDEIEDENKKLINSINGDAEWDDFYQGYSFSVEAGKMLSIDENRKIELSIGYQSFQSKELKATIRNGTDTFIFTENFTSNSIFIRGSYLFLLAGENLFGGPGITLGYSPSASVKFNINKGDQGVFAQGEGDGLLFELFCRTRYQITKSFSLTFNAGYRFQTIDDLILNVSNLVTFNTTTKVDSSGIFGKSSIVLSF